MKKLLLACAMMVGFAGISFAQTTASKSTKPAPAKSEAKKPATDAKTTAPAKTATPAAKATNPAAAEKVTDKNGTVLKKDGTPDKRYKESKAKHVKKDGTPDKRFKENKKS